MEIAGSEKTLDSFLRVQLESAADLRELRRRGEGLLGEIARDAVPLVERLLPGELHVRVSNSGRDRDGRTTIEVLVADQAFLVDTFRLSLNRLELRVLLLLHPLLPIERDDDGASRSWASRPCHVSGSRTSTQRFPAWSRKLGATRSSASCAA